MRRVTWSPNASQSLTTSASASSAHSQSSVAKLPGKPGRRPGRRPGRPKGSTSKKSTTAKKGTRRRKRRGGTRADQAVKLIQQNPGITASEIAKSMKIKPNYLYRVLSDLEKQKRVKKKGRTYSAAK